MSPIVIEEEERSEPRDEGGHEVDHGFGFNNEVPCLVDAVAGGDSTQDSVPTVAMDMEQRNEPPPSIPPPSSRHSEPLFSRILEDMNFSPNAQALLMSSTPTPPPRHQTPMEGEV